MGVSLKKTEAKELLGIIQPRIKQLEDENLPELKMLIKKVVVTRREEAFFEWKNNLPGGLLPLLNGFVDRNGKILVEEKEFFPPLFHGKNFEFEQLVYSYDNSMNQLVDFKRENFSTLKFLEEQLIYIVNNDASFIVNLFKSKAVKDKVKESKYIVENNRKIIDDFLLSITKWDRVDKSISAPWSGRKINQYRILPIIQDVIDVSRSKEYTLETAEKYIKTQVDRLSENCKMQLADEINKAWNGLVNQQIEIDLSKLPLSILSSYYEEKQKIIPYAVKCVFQNILEMVQSKKSIQSRCNLSEEEDKFLQAGIEQIVEKVKKDVNPKFDISNVDYYQERLLKLLYIYKYYPKEREKEEESIFWETENWLQKYEKLIDLSENRYVADTKLDETQYYFWDKSETELYADVIYIEDKVKKVYKIAVPTSNSITLDTVKTDFRRDAATYYALLEKITGKNQSNTASDLPKIIIDKVNKIELEQTGLKVTMRPYQEFGSKFLLFQKNVLLGNEMGLGKTIQALAVANHLFQNHKKHIVIILPLSVLENWKRETQKWTNLPVYRFCTSNKNRFSDFKWWKQYGGILLANYEQSKAVFELIGEEKLDMVIIDEAHFIKNPHAMRTVNSINISKRASYKLFMTGTPLENNVKEMQHLLKTLNPDLPVQTFRERPDSKDFKRYIANVYLRRKRVEVLSELPEMEVIDMWSEFSEEQKELYETEAFSESCSVMKLRRLAFLGENSGKINQIKEICLQARENGLKVLVFSFFKTDVLYQLKDILDHTAKEILSGDISPSRRQEIIDEFSEDLNQTVLLGQIEAGGVGLNIQSANIVVLCEPQWKPSTEQQAISRVYRMGQTRDVVVYRLLTKDSIDESILQLLHKKEVEFDTYAKDSLIADAFSISEKMSDKDVQSKIIEIERARILQKRKNQEPA